MVDFGGMADKAKEFADQHDDKIDEGIDKAADAAGNRFGHEEQIDDAAEKLKGMTGDNENN